MSQESNLPATPSVNVRGWVNPYHPQATVFGKVMAGTTVADAISKACKASRARKRYMRRGLVYLGRKQPSGDYKWTRIPQENWNKVRLHTGDALTFRLLPTGGGGGKNPFRTILNIVVMAAAVAAAVFTAGASMFAAGATLAGATITGGLTVGGLIAGALAGGLVMTMGQMLVDAIAPIKTPSMNTIAADNDDVYSLSSSSNSIDKWGRVPILFGKGRIAPKKAAAPYSELDGDDMYLHELFIWGECGTGDIKISDLRIGETSVSEYDDFEVQTWRYDPADPWYSKLYPTGIEQEEFSILVKNSEGYYVRQSKTGASRIGIDLNFPTLVKFNDKGDATKTSVTFDIGYRKVGDTDWVSLGTRTVADNATFTLSGDYSSSRPLWVYIDTSSNTIKSKKAKHDNPPSGVPLYKVTYYSVEKVSNNHILSGFDYTTDTVTESYTDEYGGSYTTQRIVSITVQPGTWAWNKGSLTVTASSTSAIRRTYNIGGLDGTSAYEVRVKRITEDHDSDSKEDTKIQDDAYWTALRTHSNKRPFNIDYPAVFTAVRVKATDQLNGSLQNFTGQYQAMMKAYNHSTKTWELQETRGLIPAIRFALQECSARPQPDSVIDWNNFIETDKYWNSLGWKYDKVLDSQQSVLSVVQDICAAGLASPTFIDGKWAVIVDKPRTEVVMGITSANSWGWSVDRVTSELPHVIQCDFVNENTWEADMREIEVDTSYKTEGCPPIVEKVTFDGVTVPDNVYKQARFHYADAKMQVRTISMTMWDESLVATRGDLVSISQPYLIPKDLEAGRIKSVFYDSNGYVTGITTDIANTINQESDLGIRIYMDDGTTAHAQLAVNTTGNARTQKLVFAETITANIKKGNKYVLGYYSEKESLAIIKSMKFNADFSCQLTLVDYIEDKYKVFDPDFIIPPFQSIISRPIYAVTTLTPPPVVQRIVTDEGALIRIGKTIKSRALVYFGIPAKLDRRAISIRCAYRVHNTMTDGDEVVPGKWIVFATIPVSETVVFCDEVEDGHYYDFRFQYVSAVGYTSEWTQVNNVKVIGKITSPLAVENFSAVLDDPRGVKLTWEAVTTTDLDYYDIGGAVSLKAVDSTVIVPVYKITGALLFTVRVVDTIGLKSEIMETSITITPPVAPAIRSAQLLDEGIVAQWASSKTSWSIDRYDVKSGDASVSSSSLRAVVPVSVPFTEGSVLTVQAKDIFDNWSETSKTAVTVYPPKAPVVKLGADKLTGKLTLDWQDCRNAVAGAPSIARYDVAGTLANQQSSSGVVSVQGTHYEALVPLTAYEYGALKDEDGIEVQVGTVTVQVTAVDKWGVETQGKEVQLSILPPYNPTRMAFAATEEGTSIVLTWRDCTRTFAIDYYTVYDSWQKKTYKVSTNTVVLPMRSAGEYSVTVQAFDVIGHSSAAMTYPLEVSGVGGVALTAAVDGADILLEWSIPSGTFVIDHYVIMRDNDRIPSGGEGDAALDGFVGTAKTNFFRVPAGQAGQYVYYVWAVDVAGNVSAHDDSHVSITVEPPSAPAVSAELGGDGVRLSWSSEVGANQLPVRAWDVVRQWDAVRDDGLTETREQDYGRLDVDTTTVPAFTAGDHTFLVRAVDSGGNVGPWGVVDFMAEPPGRVTFAEPTVIDNNVHLYWSQPSRIFFPIREYIFTEEELYEDGTQYSMEIGRVDALFANQTEETAGTFTYGVTPVDMGGNLGEKTVITLRVSNPQGFKFFGRVESLFNGEKQSFVLDGRGSMLGPVPDAETWAENVDRVAGLTGLAADTLTHQQKVNAGYRTWLEPRTAQAVYVETTDHGALVPSSNITVSVTQQTLDGEPELTCKIEVSQDGEDWELVSDSAFAVYATSFRYSRVTLTVTGGYVKISGIVIDLNIKQLTDYGRSRVYAADARGTWIPFGVSFVDVNSLPKPNVLNVEGAEAFTVFEDVLNPQGFSAYVLDKNNARIDAEIDWVAYGV